MTHDKRGPCTPSDAMMRGPAAATRGPTSAPHVTRAVHGSGSHAWRGCSGRTSHVDHSGAVRAGCGREAPSFTGVGGRTCLAFYSGSFDFRSDGEEGMR
ncbi:hypothetical protein QJS04_geneDACA013131 [Acorus gramineus]|uniref:Uncharacterized protein n=1 Tax=Acorus gramineus TaxID=55184 RepID=A0AAV9B6M6_ACOGR|nr:hypothetical protein QJS04_geneDACA013131 [Acorus gramineus]